MVSKKSWGTEGRREAERESRVSRGGRDTQGLVARKSGRTGSLRVSLGSAWKRIVVKKGGQDS